MLAHENPMLEVSPCGINFHDLISLIRIFQSYLKPRSENFPDKKTPCSGTKQTIQTSQFLLSCIRVFKEEENVKRNLKN